MILADTSVWVDHLRHTDVELVKVIQDDQLICHPFIIGEIALGSLKNRDSTLEWFNNQTECTVATDLEVMAMIERHELYAMGIGYIDAHLLASILLDTRTMLWTRDRRLRVAARKAGASLYEPPAASH